MNFNYLISFPHLPLLASFVYALANAARLSPWHRPVLYLVIVEFLFQTLAAVLSFSGLENVSLLYVYTPLNFSCSVYFYSKLLGPQFGSKMAKWLIPAFLVFTLIDAFFIEGIESFSSVLLTVRSSILLILSISAMTIMLDLRIEKESTSLQGSLHWINGGFLVYHASSILLFYFSDIIMYSLSNLLGGYTWVLHSVFSFILYVCFLVGLWKSPKR